MSTSNYTDFNLPRNAYAAFDATSMKQLITNRLKNSGLFPDIDYEGSNISGLVDVLSYSYHVLMFYLNQTSSDTLFSQSELLENMNKIVSLVSYKPNGPITASVKFDAYGTATLPVNAYNIKRYSYINVNGISYSLNSDIPFNKTSPYEQYISSVGSNNLLHQGAFREYPSYIAIGELFENVIVNINYNNTTFLNKFVDYNNIFVYVKDVNTQKWSQWDEASNIFLYNNISKVFEKRFNANNNIEIKFGNNINGKALQQGDEVQIYYLESDGSYGQIGSNLLSEGKLFNFNSQRLADILTDIGNPNGYMNANELLQVVLKNSFASIPNKPSETVDEIRTNLPAIFSAQNRLVTSSDYESFILKNFSNTIHDAKVVSNKDYVNEYIAYFYNLGLERPNLDERFLLNQISFNDSCDFNNIYLFISPTYGAISNETTPNQIYSSQKELIYNKLTPFKMINHNIVISDPIYIAFSLGLPSFNETLTTDIVNDTYLKITRQSDQLISKDQIKSNVFLIIKNFFDQNNNNLGGLLDFNKLSFDILNTGGIKKIETVRRSTEYSVDKLNFMYWNPFHDAVDIGTINQNLALKYFQFPFYYKITNLINNIEVV
jgi:hypothetical protein